MSGQQASHLEALESHLAWTVSEHRQQRHSGRDNNNDDVLMADGDVADALQRFLEAQALRAELLSVEDRLGSLLLALPEEVHAYLALFCGADGIRALAQTNMYFSKLLAPDSYVWQRVPELSFPSPAALVGELDASAFASEGDEDFEPPPRRGMIATRSQTMAAVAGGSAGAGAANAASNRAPSFKTIFKMVRRAKALKRLHLEGSPNLCGRTNSSSPDYQPLLQPGSVMGAPPPFHVVNAATLPFPLPLGFQGPPMSARMVDFDRLEDNGSTSEDDENGFDNEEGFEDPDGAWDGDDTPMPDPSSRRAPRRRRRGPRLLRLLRFCPGLVQLDVSGTNVVLDAIAFPRVCPQLRVLRAAAAQFNPAVSQTWLFDLTSRLTLEELDLSGSRGLMLSQAFPPEVSGDKLHTLSLSGAQLGDQLWTTASVAFQLVFPALRTLRLDSTFITDAIVQQEIPKIIGLRELSLASCPHLSNVALIHPNLQKLDLSGIPSLSSVVLDCLQLEDLSLHSSFLKRLAMRSHAMKYLELHDLRALERVTLACRSLLRLHLRDCPELRIDELGLGECPRLEEVHFHRMLKIQANSLVELCVQNDDGSPLLPGLKNVVVEDCIHFHGISVPAHCSWTSLTVRNCPVDDPEDCWIKVPKSKTPTLKFLTVQKCPAKDDVFEALLGIAPPKTGRNQAPDATPTTKVELRTSIAQHLVELDLSYCPRVTEGFVQRALAACEQLQVLRLRECKWVFSLDLTPSSRSVPTLRELDLESCSNLTKLVVGSSAATMATVQLQLLNLTWCTKLEELHVTSSVLQEVSLKGCTGIRALSLDSQVLSTLAISNTVRLDRLELNLPSLTELVLSKLVTITNEMVDTVLARSGNLKRLNILGCRQLTTLNLANQHGLRALSLLEMRSLKSLIVPPSNDSSLTSLEISMCAGLTQQIVEAVVGSCPRLRTFSCRLMPGLTSPTFESGSLDSVQFRQCQKLREVHLRCPRLYRLAARGVPALKLVDAVCQSLKVIEVDPVRGGAKKPVGIEHLRLTRLPKLSRAVVVRLSTIAPYLTRLELVTCQDIQQSAIDLLPVMFPGKQISTDKSDTNNMTVSLS